ncbi:MAG TPA: MmcQ/YjbR family DNA-binding protein [Bacteroidia bacterium]|nr:MmcQ/YjbR family DNA-binding protein [Bacteroidia bacterium]
MITPEEVRTLALSMPETVELPHFEKTSFRVKKKIFATMDTKSNLVCVMLSLVDQSAFSAYDKTVIYPVPNAWGKHGATYINLKKVKKTMFKDALSTAYNHIATKSAKQKAAKSPAKKRKK